jgi:small subunit ribosomal protein S14
MAKLSMINKNERRKALVVKYAGKYAVLKAIANDESRSDEERLMARLKMAELPRNANPTRVPITASSSFRASCCGNWPTRA